MSKSQKRKKPSLYAKGKSQRRKAKGRKPKVRSKSESYRKKRYLIF